MTLPGELRYACRSLAKSPVFTAVAVLSLALGIGANTAVFTLFDQVLLDLLPVRNPNELVQLKEAGHHYGSNTGMNSLSYPMYVDLRERNQVFSGMLCRHQVRLSVSEGGRSERTAGELVSGSYFQVLGIRAALGRLFTPEEDRARGGAPVAVLGYDYWQNRFAGDPAVLGRQLLVNNHKLTVVGVTGRGFEGVDRLFATQIYIPVMMSVEMGRDRGVFEDRRYRWVQVFARLKPGVSRETAEASLQPIFHQILDFEVQQKEFARASPYTREQFLQMSLQLLPGGTGMNVARGFLAPALYALMAMVALVLLIACANVANLMIARAAARQKEMAIRLSLGAGRGRIVRQLLVESLLLSVAGGAVGLASSPPIMRLLIGIMPHMDPPLRWVANPNTTVLLFNLGVSLLTAVLFGLAPALRAARPDLARTLKDQAGAVAGGGQARWRKALVSVQVGLSVLLLVSAGLFAGSLRNLEKLNPGFQVENVLTFAVDPSLNGYDTERTKLFYRQMTTELTSLPGARSAALAVVPLLGYNDWDSTVTVEGYTAKPGEDMNPWVNYVSPGFFRTLKIPVLAGRTFTERDSLGAGKVCIVNEKFARRFFGGRSAVGRHIGRGGDPGTKTDIEIVGVVSDTRYFRMRDEPPRQVFFPYLQNDWAGQMTVYVRSGLGPDQMFPLLREAVRRRDPNLPVYLMKTLEAQRDDSLAIERLAASLSTAFGVVAALLAAIGLYGVMAFLVARRTREIGIRMALGAIRGDVVWMVMREVLLLAGVGVAAGVPAALGVARLISSQLYGISPADPRTLGVVGLGIAAVSALAGYIPARRATRVDPIAALRYE